MRWGQKIERLLLAAGIVMLGLYGAARIHRAVLANASMQAFEDQASLHKTTGSDSLASSKPDFSSWSQQRIKGYEESLAKQFSPATGILRIPKIGLEVPILEGTDELTLNRGVGRIAGTAKVGEPGNIGIAGHRDGFFRGLKDLGTGDKIEVVTGSRTETYVIDNVVIVDPSSISVLASRSHPSLTLVTCYPFYFVGSAPKRYVVQASIDDSQPAVTQVESQASTTVKSQPKR